jgi:hypothetical protein
MTLGIDGAVDLLRACAAHKAHQHDETASD